MEIVMMGIGEITPYEKNPRINDNAVDAVAASIKEFGFKQPILVDEARVIIAGHTRFKASKKLGITEVPVIVATDLSDEQVRAFRLADNKTAEIALWDDALLKGELDAIFGIDMAVFGFENLLDGSDDEDDKYTRNITIPHYEITGECPKIEELVNPSKTAELLDDIERSDLPEAEKDFLRKAASRHSIFDYGKIAEYYAHATPEMQELMERSALVIIDYEDAIRNGYVALDMALMDDMEGDDDEE